jgi:DNA-directed RNA polymerase specialized sigma24 family protein
MAKAKPQPAEPPPATPEQIRDAFEALTPIELARLATYARWRLRAFGSRQLSRDADEFVTDALMSLLDGRRTWQPEKISFYVCFRGVMQSQTHNLRTKGPEDAFDELKSLRKKDDMDTAEPLDRRTSRTFQDPERELEWAQIEGLIKGRFADDDEAALMLEARLEGKTPTEIREALELTQQQYETILKRVRRAIAKILEGSQP